MLQSSRLLINANAFCIVVLVLAHFKNAGRHIIFDVHFEKYFKFDFNILSSNFSKNRVGGILKFDFSD